VIARGLIDLIVAITLRLSAATHLSARQRLTLHVAPLGGAIHDF
jgi:hypothetical protein